MRRTSPSSHAQFFNSLKQLEKRLKLENPPPSSSIASPQPPPPPLPIHTEEQSNSNYTQQTDSLGTPMYLIENQPSANTSSTFQESETPREFLSNPPDFLPIENNPFPEKEAEIDENLEGYKMPNLDDEIELLMQLLNLSNSDSSNIAGKFESGCDDEFYERVVGVKGPKNVKEVDRLEGWIKHYLNEEKKEPLRLAYLLLGKAALAHSDDDCDGFGGFEFPSTLGEFLQNDSLVD